MNRITLEDFGKLSRVEKEFILTYGSDNCTLVKFNPDLEDILCNRFGKDTYDEEDMALLGKLATDGKWHLMHLEADLWDNEYFLCGDDNLVFVDECFLDESENIKHLIDRK